jgi:hypothetical protein
MVSASMCPTYPIGLGRKCRFVVQVPAKAIVGFILTLYLFSFMQKNSDDTT